MSEPLEDVSDRPGRRGNGLTAPAYVPLADVDAELADHLLSALGRARIAAYLEPRTPESAARHRLYVAADERSDARTIVQSAARAALPGAGAAHQPDLLDGMDTEAEFAALIADWHVDTVAAIRAAEQELTAEDSDWRGRVDPPATTGDDGEEHYVPPPPPPLPRLAPVTVWALVVIVLSVLLLALGGLLDLPGSLGMLLGIGGLLVGAGMLVMRLRAHPEVDEGDDGAIL